MRKYQTPQTERDLELCIEYNKKIGERGIQANLARKYSVTPERIRQILIKNGLKKPKTKLVLDKD